jgi:hypothetical protein
MGARADGTSVPLFCYCVAAVFAYAALFAEIRYQAYHCTCH